MRDDQEQRQDEMSYRDFGLTPEEGQELRDRLDPGEWQGLLAVQQMLSAAPVASPDAGFSNRVLARLATRERVRSQRRAAFGALAFGLGTMLLTAYFVWSSPLGALGVPGSLAGLVNGIAALIQVAATVLVVLRSFWSVVWEGEGATVLVLLALFAAGLALVWSRIVMRPALANRPIRASEAH